MWDEAGMWGNRSISISHFWSLIVGLLINRGCCLLGARCMAAPRISILHRNHPRVNCGVESGSSLTVAGLCASLWTFCAWYQPCGRVRADTSSPLPPRRPTNVKNTCLQEEAAQLWFLPRLRGQIALEKSIPRAGQSLKLILLCLLVRTLCAT